MITSTAPIQNGDEKPATVPRQWTREVACSEVFLSLTLEFPALGAEAAASAITEQLFKDVLVQALTDLYGVIGGAINLKLLKLEGCTALIRVDKRDEDKMWAAASFATQYGSHDVRLTVNRSSPFLALMAVDSRQWAVARLGASLALA